MAEIVGVVASGINIASLVAQIANSVTKLKSYWDELKEVPEDIGLLIEEIEDLYLLLYDIQDDQRRNPMSSKLLDNASTSRCLEHCKRGADGLKKLADDLGSDINTPDRLRRKWASAKVVFKKDKIEKYKARLERAIRLLSLSHQCYTRALLQLQPDIIVSRISHTMHTLQNNNNAFSSSSTTAPNELSVTACQSQTEIYGSQDVHIQLSANQHTTQISNKRVKRREELIARYRVSVWAMRWAWDVEFFRSRSGWIVRLNPTNLISQDSPVYKAIKDRDLIELQRLFMTGQASTSDRSVHCTLLQLASFYKAYPICQFLLEHGADPNDAACDEIPPLRFLMYIPETSDVRAGVDMLGLMVNVYDAEFPTLMVRDFCGPNEAFLSLQQNLEAPYYETHLELRAEVAMGLVVNAPTNSPELFRLAFAMHPGPIPVAAIHYKAYDGKTLLHAVAYATGVLLQSTHPRKQKCIENLPGWRALGRELVTNGADLHAVWTRNEWGLHGRILLTPFLTLLFLATYYACSYTVSQTTDHLLKLWVEDLDTCGVDLLEYGRKEKALHDEMPILRDFCSLYPAFRSIAPPTWRLIGFKYGSSPSDWRIWGSEPSDECAGDFWSLVEPPELVVPGSWID